MVFVGTLLLALVGASLLGGAAVGGAGIGRDGGPRLADEPVDERWENGGALSTSDFASRVNHGMYGPFELAEFGREDDLEEDFELGREVVAVVLFVSTRDLTGPPWRGW